LTTLFEFDRPRPASFKLALGNAPDFECAEIVRCIPGKRLVCRGTWNSQAVYAKLFIGEGAGRYAERDANGVRALIGANITTPPLLFTGTIEKCAIAEGGEALIFGEIALSINTEDALDRLKTERERLSLARSLVREVARHHIAGLIQHDLYLKNFLFDADRTIYTLDGDGVRHASVLWGQKQMLQNLVVLLSKFDVLDEAAWLPALLQDYAKERGWSRAINVESMRRKVSRYRRQVVHGYADKKVFRQCSDVDVKKSWKAYTAVSKRYAEAAVQTLLADPGQLMNQFPGKRLKSGNTATVSLIEVAGRKAVVKRYNIKSVWHGFGRMFRASRATVSWSNAHRLKMYGIATASPLALKEERFGLLRFWAWFVAQYIEAPDIGSWMDNAAFTMQQRTDVAGNVAGMLYKMRLLQIAHGDLKASNIHIVDLQPVLIDLDSLHEYKSKALFERRHIRDLQRLLRNWQAKPQIYALMVNALEMVYGDDPLLAKAGLEKEAN
jgi:tRNA A-37 threonylcarbamoyl transferase component Bud32